MIKNIVFDMGGVLIDFNPVKFVNLFDISEEDKDLVLKSVFYCPDWIDMDRGFIDEDGMYEIAKGRLPERLWPVAKHCIYLWDEPVLDHIPGMEELLNELKSKGYNFYLLSNASRRHDAYWPKVKMHNLFDGKVVSAFELVIKPDIKIYNILFDRFNLNPAECLFVDDVKANIDGSIAAGMDGIVFTGVDDLRKELIKRNIL